ncbi:hypothetical protein NXX68_00195 [Bacteroides fragilis]|nr:hypothetical protein [Bacteroides fragilis]
MSRANFNNLQLIYLYCSRRRKRIPVLPGITVSRTGKPEAGVPSSFHDGMSDVESVGVRKIHIDRSRVPVELTKSKSYLPLPSKKGIISLYEPFNAPLKRSYPQSL